MLENRTKVLLILSQDALDRARVVAGTATTALKLPVSLQIVLRALIEEGLKRVDHPALIANIEGQAKAVRAKRSGGWRVAESARPRAKELATQRDGQGPQKRRVLQPR
jgi:hypothetical protein